MKEILLMKLNGLIKKLAQKHETNESNVIIYFVQNTFYYKIKGQKDFFNLDI